MKIVYHSQNVLILKERPIDLWIIGGIFTATGLYTLIILTQKQDVQLKTMLFFAGLYLTFGYIGIITPVVTCVFSRFLKTVTLKKQNLFGRKAIEHCLSEIQDIQVEESTTDTDNITCYRVSIVLISGGRLPLTSNYSSGYTSKQQIVSRIRDFLNM